MKPRFEGDLDLRHRKEPEDGKWFTLLAPFSYYSENGDWYLVPKWTNTDFASIPKPLRMFISRVGWHSQPAVFHDWLCAKKIVDRRKADKLFKESLKVALKEYISFASGIKRLWRKKGWIKLRTMYAGVRTYSIATFKR
jgi:hypothetical protein